MERINDNRFKLVAERIFTPTNIVPNKGYRAFGIMHLANLFCEGVVCLIPVRNIAAEGREIKLENLIVFASEINNLFICRNLLLATAVYHIYLLCYAGYHKVAEDINLFLSAVVGEEIEIVFGNTEDFGMVRNYGCSLQLVETVCSVIIYTVEVGARGPNCVAVHLTVHIDIMRNRTKLGMLDQSDGFFRRQIVLTTKDRPADRTDDPFLVEKLMSEMEGIFLWCLEGLHRLLANNYQFTISGQAIENVETVKRSSNNVIEFLQSEGYIRFKADSEASSKALYEAYKLWCEDNVRKPMSANRLSSELAQNERLYNVEATNNIYVGGKRVRGFVGIEVLAKSSFLKW